MTNFGRQYLTDSELRALPFRSVGQHVSIHHKVNLINVENIVLGSNVRIDSNVTIIASGPVTIGSYVHIGAQCYLAAGAGLEMQDFSGLSQDVKLYTTSDDYSGRHLTNPTVPPEYLGVTRGRILLERHVIIGAGAIVLPNAIIREGCAIGALTLVKRSTESWGIYSGIPAKRIGTRDRHVLELEKRLWIRSDQQAPPQD